MRLDPECLDDKETRDRLVDILPTLSPVELRSIIRVLIAEVVRLREAA